jgi:succinyl-CoA synthetase beta subunit
MKLLEYKGKELLKSCGIKVPPGIVTDNKSYVNLSYHKEKYRDFFFEHKEVVLKAQVVSGKRKKLGLVLFADEFKESLAQIDKLYNTEFQDTFVDTLLIEKKLDIANEYYLSILWDTRERAPRILLGKGGIDVEEDAKEVSPETLVVDILDGLHDYQARSLAKAAGFTGRNMTAMATFIKNAYTCFLRYDCRILEINPVIQTPEGFLYAGDAKITIDDSGVIRQEVFKDVTEMEDRSLLSERALEARKIDYHDHRGVAGKTFVELDGDIAVLASGGGGSLTAMDSLLEAGGKAANYVEYSGDPPKEKVRKLAKITLSKKGLKGCLIIGGRANFTDIYETMTGIIEGILELKGTPFFPTYPIVVRRAGPRDKEAFLMLKNVGEKEGLDLALFGEEISMSEAARIMVEKAHARRVDSGEDQ